MVFTFESPSNYSIAAEVRCLVTNPRLALYWHPRTSIVSLALGIISLDCLDACQSSQVC